MLTPAGPELLNLPDASSVLNLKATGETLDSIRHVWKVENVDQIGPNFVISPDTLSCAGIDFFISLRKQKEGIFGIRVSFKTHFVDVLDVNCRILLSRPSNSNIRTLSKGTSICLF